MASIARAKSIFASKTAWLNGLATVVALVTAFQSQPWVAEYPKISAACVAVLTAANVILRILTTRPVTVV